MCFDSPALAGRRGEAVFQLSAGIRARGDALAPSPALTPSVGCPSVATHVVPGQGPPKMLLLYPKRREQSFLVKKKIIKKRYCQ